MTFAPTSSSRSFALVFAVGLLAAACTGAGSVDPAELSFPDPSTTFAPATTAAVVVIAPPTTVSPQVIPKGGSISIGVWGEPDPTADTLTGEMIRSLTQPQLFTAMPDGTWAASLVDPGTDADGPELRSATFRLRTGAVWSDGSRIQGGHLWDSRDRRFVEEINVADDGLYTVTFNQPLPNWRRLWSGADVVEPPADGLYGGPWKVASFNPELEAILVPNETWWGDGPYLDELRLVVVPNQGVMFDIFNDGELDVIAPNAVTGRVQLLEKVAPGRVATAVGGGWWVGTQIEPDTADLDDRLGVLSALDRKFFVGALLKGEAVVVPSLGGGSVSAPTSALGSISHPITITAPDDIPMLGAVERAVLLAIRSEGGVGPELREGTSDLAESWIRNGEAEAHIALHFDGPGGPCWTCRFGHVDEAAARIADGGGEPLDQLLADVGVLQVLWRPIVAVAWAQGVNGIVANGWSISAAWNAHEWWAG